MSNAKTESGGVRRWYEGENGRLYCTHCESERGTPHEEYCNRNYAASPSPAEPVNTTTKVSEQVSPTVGSALIANTAEISATATATSGPTTQYRLEERGISSESSVVGGPAESAAKKWIAENVGNYTNVFEFAERAFDAGRAAEGGKMKENNDAESEMARQSQESLGSDREHNLTGVLRDSGSNSRSSAQDSAVCYERQELTTRQKFNQWANKNLDAYQNVFEWAFLAWQDGFKVGAGAPSTERAGQEECPHTMIRSVSTRGGKTSWSCVRCKVPFGPVTSSPSGQDAAGLLQPLKDACDRDWDDETPEQIVAVAANAIHWRQQRAESAERALDQMKEALKSIVAAGKVEYSRDHGMPNPSPPFPVRAVLGLQAWEALAALAGTEKG